MMRRSIVVGLVVLLGAVTAGPAAADEEIGLSRDGVAWTSRLTQPLFDSAVRWVPGDSRTSTFYVRNQAVDDARLTVDVLGSRIDALLETGDLTVSARADRGEWRSVTGTGTRRLVSTIAAESRDPVRLDVRVDLDAASPNGSQTLRLDVDLRIRLAQSTASGSPGADGSGGLLPDTGGAGLWVLVVGLVLAGGGSVMAAHRHREEESHV